MGKAARTPSKGRLLARITSPTASSYSAFCHNGTGTLSGIPTASGIFNITITASNAVSAVTQSFVLTVAGGVSQVSISPTSVNFGDVYLLSLQSNKVTIQNQGTSAISMGKPSITQALTRIFSL